MCCQWICCVKSTKRSILSNKKALVRVLFYFYLYFSVRFHSGVFVGAKTYGVAVVVYGIALLCAMPVGKLVEIVVEDFRAAVRVHFCDVCRFAVGQERVVHHCAAHNVNVVFVVLFDCGKQFVERAHENVALCICVFVCAVWVEHDVYAIFERHTARERQKGVAAHNHHFAARVLDKMAHIRLEIEQQVVFLAQSPFVVNCKYRFHQIATSIFFSSFVY